MAFSSLEKGAPLRTFRYSIRYLPHYFLRWNKYEYLPPPFQQSQIVILFPSTENESSPFFLALCAPHSS
jgi:hypothetical protein